MTPAADPCPSCGAAVDASAAYCTSCGTRIGSADPPADPAAPAASRTGSGPRSSRAASSPLDRLRASAGSALSFLPPRLRKPAVVAVGLVLLLVIAVALAPEDDAVAGADLPPVQSDGDARFLVTQVLRASYHGVVSELPDGEHGGTVVSGDAGRATVSGHKSYQDGISCGTDCVRSETDHDLTITFERFRTRTAENVEVVLTGTVAYRDDGWSQQSGGSYSSGGGVAISGSSVDAAYVGTDAAGTFGTADVITFSASAGEPHVGSVSGSCTAGDGSAYSF